MPLQGLANQIYQILRLQVPRNDPRISYQDLLGSLGSLPPPLDSLTAYDPRLSAALGEIRQACLNHDPPLPDLSVILVRRQSDRTLSTPVPSYFSAVHPEVETELDRLITWAKEIDQARSATYPEIL